MGVFPVINRLNHACLPNCSVRWDKETDRLQLFSMQEIQAGAELTISYYDMLSNPPDRQSRQEYLSKHFYFTCNCSLCSLTGHNLNQDDTNRREVAKLYQSLKESGCHDDTESLELMTQLYEYFKTTPYP